ncbi:MAG: cytochrome c biogenesis protein CcdA [Dehalococcoidia bacterium]|nr:cytochrome c biogenesis protein CcdA [Dehalococcoidia bacterium]
MGRRGSEGVKIELGRSSVGRGGRLLLLAEAGLIVAAVMGLLLLTRDRAEAFVANAAVLLPFGYAFGAGMVSSVNPCGFFMLPSYLSYYLGTEEKGVSGTPGVVRVLRAVELTLVATAGFVLVFAAVGSVIALGGRPLVAYFPYGGLLIGVAMAALGLWLLLRHQSLGIAAASRVVVTPRRNLFNGFLFGLAYAIGSLSCTLPIFLVVVGSALVTRGFAASLGQFVAYSLGMGTVLVAAIIGTALFRGAVTRALQSALPYVHTVSALFLMAAGLYLVYYWVVVGDIFS